MALKQNILALEQMDVIMNLDREYKYGDVSLAFGRLLFIQGELEKAKEHLQLHLKEWSHPEAHYLMANILVTQGDQEKARKHLETILEGIKGAPKFH